MTNTHPIDDVLFNATASNMQTGMRQAYGTQGCVESNIDKTHKLITINIVLINKDTLASDFIFDCILLLTPPTKINVNILINTRGKKIIPIALEKFREIGFNPNEQRSDPPPDSVPLGG